MRLLADRQRSLEKRLGVGVATPVFVEYSQVVERIRDIVRVRPSRLLADRQRSLEKQLGIRVATLRLVEISQVVERSRDIVRVRASRLLEYRQRPREERLGVRVATLRLVEIRQEQTRNSLMVGTDSFLADRQQALCQRYGFGVLSGVIQLQNSFFQRGTPVLLCNRGRVDTAIHQQHGRQDKPDRAIGFQEKPPSNACPAPTALRPGTSGSTTGYTAEQQDLL